MQPPAAAAEAAIRIPTLVATKQRCLWPAARNARAASGAARARGVPPATLRTALRRVMRHAAVAQPPAEETHRTPSTAAQPAAPLPAWASRPDYAWRGVGVALAVIAAWAGTLCGALALPLASAPVAGVLALQALLCWLYTALFITAHDAMHALVAPRHRRLNDALGSACVAAYAQFDYSALCRAHVAHHRAPASPQARRARGGAAALHGCLAL
jgi:hypothetical protein